MGAGAEDTTDSVTVTDGSSRRQLQSNGQDADAQADAIAYGYQDMISLDGSLEHFVKVGYEYVTTDYTKGIGQGRVKTIKIPAKTCTAEDLELSEEENDTLMSVWQNYTLLCPAFDDIGKTDIQGDSSSRLTKNLVFEVNKCEW